MSNGASTSQILAMSAAIDVVLAESESALARLGSEVAREEVAVRELEALLLSGLHRTVRM